MVSNLSKIKINEIFVSIQGEGLNIGLLSIFIRFSGCNLKCNYCDTEHHDGEIMAVNDILKRIKDYKIKEVCITGGEPLIQLEGLKVLVKELKALNYTITLETNGTIYDEIFNLVDLVSFDVKMPSSGVKSDLDLIEKLDPTITQLKFVIGNLTSDYEDAKKIVNDYITSKNLEFPIIFMPVSEGKKEYTKNDIDLFRNLTIKVLEEKVNVRVLPQLHKILVIK